MYRLILISNSIFINVVSCIIAQAFCKNAFDHKHIMLSFKKKRNKGRICINDRILTNPLLDCAVKLAIYECYISEIATVPGGLIEIVVEDLCQKLHDIDQQFNEWIFLQGKSIATGLSAEETARMEELTEDLPMAWGRVMDYDTLQQYLRNCDDDIFFEELIGYCTKAALRVQNLV